MDTCVNGSICADLVKGIPAAFVAFVIGAIAARIAYNQYLVAKAKLKLDLFDKRLAIYTAVWTELSTVATTDGDERNWGFSTPFNEARTSARFLFGKQIEEYIDLCIKNWLELGVVRKTVENPNANASQRIPNPVLRQGELQAWFHGEATSGAKDRFAGYLNFEQWK